MEKYCYTVWYTAWRSSPDVLLVTGPLGLLGLVSGGNVPVDVRIKLIVGYFLKSFAKVFNCPTMCTMDIVT